MSLQPNIITKLEQAGLTGRGGAGFPTAKKWQAVLVAKGSTKYVVCNVSEGEPGVHKDEYILEHHLAEAIQGVVLAIQTVKASRAIVYLRKDLYRTYKDIIKKEIGDNPIELFEERGGYLSGEETTLISVLEGKRAVPKLRPPFPTTHGFQGMPTLINNLETLFDVARINNGTFTHSRLYSVSGDVPKKGVYEFPEDTTIKYILNASGNFSKKDFFVQVGGGASGPILLSSELDVPAPGSGAIIVYDKKLTDPYLLLRSWVDFFMKQNCDKCVPCREGLFRLREMIDAKKLDTKTLEDLYFVLEKTSFCPLGRSVPTPIRSLIEKILV